jgi:hypothetical protein
MPLDTRRTLVALAAIVLVVGGIQFYWVAYSIFTGNEMITVYEVTRTTGYQSPIFGFIPTRQTRYIVDIQCGSGTVLGIGGVSVSLGSGHQTVVVDSNASLQKAFVSINGGTPYTVGYAYPKYNNEGFCFTPYSATISPVGTVHVYSIKQQVESKGLVTAVGSNKYQGIGYDGPHGPSYTRDSMEDIKNASMTATLFADIDSQYIYTQLSYLQDLIYNHGWDLAIHFSYWHEDLSWEQEKQQMIVEYNQIKNEFGGREPTCWSILGIGAYSTNSYNVWVYDTFGMFRRSWRMGAQAVTVGVGLYDDTYAHWKRAWDQGYAAIPVYLHQTDGSGGSGHISSTNWNACFTSIKNNGVKLTGYANVYYMAKNQEDATFQVTTSTDGYTIIPTTNGYNAHIVVAVDASTVTGVYEGITPIEYSSTPDGYITFEVENTKTYTLSTSTTPPPQPPSNREKYDPVAFIALSGIVLFLYFWWKAR